MKYMLLVVGLVALLILTSCKSLAFWEGGGGFKIDSITVTPNPVPVGSIANIAVVGRDARTGIQDCLWPHTAITVSAGKLYSTRENAEQHEPLSSSLSEGSTTLMTSGEAWWVAPPSAQRVTIKAEFGGATKTVGAEVVPEQ